MAYSTTPIAHTSARKGLYLWKRFEKNLLKRLKRFRISLRFLGNQLGTVVGNRSAVGDAHQVGAVQILVQPSEAKVGQFGITVLVQQNVVKLDVPMCHLNLIVHVSDRL